MTSEVLQMAGAALVAALTGGGLVAWINARARRPLVKAEAVERLTDSTLEWAEQLKADAAGARKDSHAARVEAEETHRQMRQVRAEAEELVAYLGWLIRTIQDPSMSIERLRVLVGNGPPLPDRNSRPR